MRMLIWPLDALAGMRGLLFPWVPVFLACGIGLWFALPWEPGVRVYAVALGLAVLGPDHLDLHQRGANCGISHRSSRPAG